MDKFEKYKNLMKNIGILTLSNFATKILSFLLVPLYTNILTTSEYGTFDLISTTIGVLIPILTLNIQEALLRFPLDNKYSNESLVTVGARYFLLSNGIVILGLIINSFLGVSSVLKDYSILFELVFISQSISGMLCSYARGMNDVADLSISSVLASISTIALNIVLLVVLKWGLTGYAIANTFGPLVQSFYLMFKLDIVNHLDFKNSFQSEKKLMTAYSIPLIANSIAWWINNTSDKYVVVFFCGLSVNGIYSIASKIPSILNIFQSIFNQAWLLSAVHEFDSKDKNGFFSKTYDTYNCLMISLCSVILILNKIIARVIYSKDFYSAWIYSSWLTIAIVFGSMSGFFLAIISVVKDTKKISQSTIISAITNLILNLIFTPLIGALGAAIATTISYFVAYIYCLRGALEYIELKIQLKRELLCYAILVLQAFVQLVIYNNYVLYSIEVILFAIIIFTYKKDILSLFNHMIKLKK